MKFRVTFKTPDAVDYAIREVVNDESDEQPFKNQYEREDFIVGKTDVYTHFVIKWVKYGETVTIEFDNIAGTATVVPN